MYFKEKLDNGTRVVMEDIPYVNSVSIGVLVNTGTKDETKDINGICHFIEHMLFKGTEKRNSKEIAEAIDNIGGHMNAFTGSEYTCFYVKVLDKHLFTAIEILADMINNPRFSEKDIENEKKVVLEEIKMYLDSPEDLVFDMLHEIMFKNSSLSLPILGSENSINNLNREVILNYYNEYYVPENMVISVVGNFNHKDMLKVLNCYFNKKTQSTIKTYNNNNISNIKKQIVGKKGNFEQVHFCLGTEGVKIGSKDQFALNIINNTFGGNMSSILFQRIREERGLAYSVYSSPISFQNTGIFSIYAALGKEEIINVSNVINDEIHRFKKELIKENELLKLKEQLKSNYILGMESTFSRMIEIGKSELLLGYVLSAEDIINNIDKVSLDDIEKVTNKIFDINKFNIAYIGDIEDFENVNKELEKIFFSR